MSAHPKNFDAQSASNSKLLIQPRKATFDFEDVNQPFFYRNNSCISAMWVALSAGFPAGESEFIKAVRLFEDQVDDPQLLGEIQSFAHQEAHHSVQHRMVNKLFDKLGYTTAKLETFFKEKLAERAQKWSAERRLARTVVAEHVTAVMAHYALTNEEAMQHFPDSIRGLFQWHAIEEIEHKSVTFDVYQHCVGDRKLLMREYYTFMLFEFPLNVLMSSRFLLRQLGHKVSWSERRELWRYLFGKGGLISSMRSQFWMFRRKGFHPWQHDDSALVEQWKVRLAPHFEAS